DHYDMARDGIADVTYVNPGYQPGRFPVIGAGELPFLMSDAKGGTMALDDWYRKYAEKEMKDVKFCLAFIHSPSAFHSRSTKIVVPDGQKKAIDNNCSTEAAGRLGEHWGKMEDSGLDKIKAESSHEVYKLTPEQIAQWKKASEPLTKTWGEGVKKNGVDPDAALAE